MAGVVLSSFSTVHQYFHFFEHWQSMEEVRTEIEIFVNRCHFSRIVKIVSMVYDTHLVILCVPSGRDVKSVNMSSVTLESIYSITSLKLVEVVHATVGTMGYAPVKLVRRVNMAKIVYFSPGVGRTVFLPHICCHFSCQRGQTPFFHRGCRTVTCKLFSDRSKRWISF